MGSANGRHRRPRQAPAIVVAAGVTGSAIAIPLLGATGAHAADASTWDRVAECESGGMWSADLGNGYYGGLQFSQDTWSAYGGSAFAPRADLASRSQQISVAEKVLEDQGPQAWPSCAVISGLALDGALPGVDPGGLPSADPSDSLLPTDDASDAPSGDATDEANKKDKSDKSGGTAGSGESDTASESDKNGETGESGGSGDSGATAPPATTPTPEASEASAIPDGTDQRGGKHRGTPAPEASLDADQGGGRDSGRHASRGGDQGRDTVAVSPDGDYTVRPGDNLWAIADAQKVPGGWTELYEANKGALGSDPDLILPGQSLDLGLPDVAEDSKSN
ncbi:LysM peptidoglycan-binding domain-containing protein [Streptomyces finlayi]|uniref:LysM peptidoglycan-binding domain-containing protein n=1 Tax=Streptomyces finlayi TaxID=67296 RepID=A0A7G7BNJ4_9ACTN|nr:transglycosylase family protein [Streptomyces finlayi]QNE76909.1 LysM peptidoglycan-binding domain-containing protein [Streptomyces finlayi]